MELYFFIRNESDNNWYNCTIEAWEENDNSFIDGKKVSSFRQLESMRIHISKLNKTTYHSCRFDHDFGTDSSTGHHEKSRKGFLAEMTEARYPFVRINHKSFQAFKKKMLKIYTSYTEVNYTERLVKEAPACRIHL